MLLTSEHLSEPEELPLRDIVVEDIGSADGRRDLLASRRGDADAGPGCGARSGGGACAAPREAVSEAAREELDEEAREAPRGADEARDEVSERVDELLDRG